MAINILPSFGNLPAPASVRHEVAFIDASITDYQSLLAGIRPGVEVVLLDGTQDGLAQMAAWAQTHAGFDAIHVLSHGAEGLLRLGTNTLDSASLADAGFAAELAQLGRARSRPTATCCCMAARWLLARRGRRLWPIWPPRQGPMWRPRMT